MGGYIKSVALKEVMLVIMVTHVSVSTCPVAQLCIPISSPFALCTTCVESLDLVVAPSHHRADFNLTDHGKREKFEPCCPDIGPGRSWCGQELPRVEGMSQFLTR